MMYFALFLLLSGDFWTDKAPAQWSQAELDQLLTNSPWAQMVGVSGTNSAAPVQVMIATAGPIESAEKEWDRRQPASKKKEQHEEMNEEYLNWLQDNQSTQIILAIAANLSPAYSDEQEMKIMENESVMRVGRKKYKITGYFPPSAGDPYLRLAFPREVKPTDKTVSFDLYIPGIGIGYRSAEFSVKDMIVKGKLEM